MRFRTLAAAFLTCVCATHLFAQTTPPPAEQPDNYQWLEDVNGDRAIAWVKEHNAKSAKVLEADPRFADLDAKALKVLESPDKLAEPSLIDGVLYNTWQDAQHVRGIFRRTSVADYMTANPHWQTLVDFDALSQHDNEKWVPQGESCLYPGNEYCFVELSAGGEDAATLREFNQKTAQFVPDGFVLPHSKQDVTWLDKDTLLVGRDWGAGTMTKSGYPFVVKLWKRGEPLEKAQEVFRGTQDDVNASATQLNDMEGHHVVLFNRSINFFEQQVFLRTPAGTPRLGLPGKLNVVGMLHGQIVVELNQDWKPAGSDQVFAQGSVVSLELKDLERDPEHLKPTAIFVPTQTEFEQEAAVTRNCIVMTTLENVQGRAYVYSLSGHAWTRKKLDVPDNASVAIETTNNSDDTFFLAVTGFLMPSSLMFGDGNAALKTAKTLPPQFDASGLTVEQLSATSKDGTRVPYFVAHRKDIKYDGSNPTLLTAYGGFQSSSTPYYSGVNGKLWLERGGVYALANIRGGGEFGPAWHEAGLKLHRQRIYDDFAAVAEDMIARKITSTRRLGIMGGSNGGLLMGVEMTQRPELWGAVVIQVPLLDMLRYEQIAAGASWVGEYGSVSVPEERAWLAHISPYNQLRRDVNYPEPFIFTTTKDDRVGPVHARKFAARMEEFGKPFYYDEIIEGGHAAGADLKEKARTWAIQYTYLTEKLMD